MNLNSFRNISQDPGHENYDKILGYFYGDSESGKGRTASVYVGIQSSQSFADITANMDNSSYQKMAGGDLSNLFFPFSTNSLEGGSYPSYKQSETQDPDIGASGLSPFKYSSTQTEGLQDVYDEDSYGAIISNDKYVVRPSVKRNTGDIRGVGFRLPMIGVGWGYDLDGNPVPGENGKFVDEVESGYQVDPSEYIAAPIDIRFDRDRGVWTASDTTTVIPVRITGAGSNGSGWYSAKEVVWDSSGSEGHWIIQQGLKIFDGTEDNYPEIYEINGNAGLESDTIQVFAWKSQDIEGNALWLFDHPDPLPDGTGEYKVLQLDANNEPHWDWVRAH